MKDLVVRRWNHDFRELGKPEFKYGQKERKNVFRWIAAAKDVDEGISIYVRRAQVVEGRYIRLTVDDEQEKYKHDGYEWLSYTFHNETRDRNKY